MEVDDLWARDTVPVFVEDDGEPIGVDFDFSGRGDRQERGRRRRARGRSRTVHRARRGPARPGFPGSPPDSWSRSADQARSALGKAADARGRRFEITDLPQPDLDRITGEGDDFASIYADFYVVNDSVFLPEFGDRAADDRAKAMLQGHFPEREVVRPQIDTVASGGGIHCATHEQPGKPAARPAPPTRPMAFERS
ncbi:agmatine deiminase family protein [Streptomyces sp. NPDC127166]|uniref:agmatine deiminase family protein n=1 Tax=Streptomyces sp. NPDC127166 TaxID=3345380 RepID=UPI00363C76C6